ncbi:sensor histidine kinase [Paracraurococcus lichenis]|uniref:histidine kinase n=1 Tax=Paracraurococcus lichenis TaxID=3064888 RepID=A0ABT9E239_9PROT|nr:HWE histidine kinase domain-containing protein [Paracraurococcus sp. LOR1-02]MDO9710227.1 HWE histidine kinase domain-containing protein [Paracraurococcus sp. LOR1-02]
MTLAALRLQKLVLLAALLVPALVFGAAAWWNRREVLGEAGDTAERSVAILHEHAARTFDTAELVLARVADRVHDMDPAQVAAPETSAFLRATRHSYEQFVSLWVSDAAGHVVAGSQPWNPATSIADRDFFRVQQDRADAGTYVSAAFTGRATTLPSFAISRRRTDAAGRFAGIIHVSLDPDYFARFYAEAAPPFRHVTGLFRADGAILARHPVWPDGRTWLQSDNPLLRHVAMGAERGRIEEPGSPDRQPRLYLFRKVGAWPVYVGFGADRSDLLGRWYENLAVYGAVAVVAALTLVALAWLALRRAQAAEVAEAALRRETAARAAAEARQAAEARFRGVFESRAVGMSVFDLETGATLLANDRLLEMTGGTQAEFVRGDWDWRQVTPAEHLPLDDRAVQQGRARGWWEPFEKEYLRPDGTRLPVRLSSAPLPGEPGRVVVLVQDISEQREAEQRRDLLMREVDHRAKNALATARAALRLTRAPTLDAFVQQVDGRIGALAQALALLSTTQWHGADLATLARGELAPFLGAAQDAGPRAELRGPPVTIGATAVQPLAMAIHELATNATKYGALSRAEGMLTLDWELPGGPQEQLRLVWRERGGPPVEAPPTGRGFGTRVMQSTLARQLGGTLDLRWEPAGLTCIIELPAARVLAGQLDAEAA